MNNKGLSLVEIVIALGILSLIVAITVVTYSEYTESSIETSTQQSLDALRKVIEAYEARTGIPCRSGPVHKLAFLQFGGSPYDYWGGPYTVDSANRIVYSFGRNAVDDKGKLDDISIEYSGITGVSSADPPLNPQASGNPGIIKVTWQAPPRSKGLTGFRVEKREDKTSEWITCKTLSIDNPTPFSWTDSSRKAVITYYRIIALYDTDRESKPSAIAGWTPVY